jgi:hypothetical protein
MPPAEEMLEPAPTWASQVLSVHGSLHLSRKRNAN